MSRILQTRARWLPVLSAALAIAAAPAADAQPTFSKVFTPSAIGPGSVSTITFTITNGSGTPVTGLSFTDVLPMDVDVADPANVSTTCAFDAGGGLSAPDGASTITLTDAQVPAFGSCTITVDVTSSVAGMHTNPAITLSSSAGSSMSLPVDLTVDASRPGFLKSFSPSSAPLGSRSTLTLTFDNTANALPVTFLSFNDNLPPGLEIADPANVSSDCGMVNFSLSAEAGGNVISLLALGLPTPGFEVVPANDSCTITVDVVSTGAGMLDNVTGDLTFRRGNDPTILSSGKASATFESTVGDLHLTKQFTDDPTPPGATAILEFTILNRDRFDSATGLGFTDDLGAALTGLTYSSLDFNDCGGMVGGLGTDMINFTGGTLAAEGSCTIRVELTVPPGATPGSYVNTTGAVSATVGGSPVVGNVASDTLYVEPVPLLTKTYVGDPVNPGDTIQLDFTVTNTSSTSSATDVAFTDFFPTVTPTASVTPGNGCCGAGSTCTFFPLVNPPPPSSVIPARLIISGGTLDPAGMANDSCNFSITLDVGANTAPGVYVNTTTEITATVDGDTRTGEPASDDFTVVAAPDLSKTFTDDPAAPGGSVTLELTLTYPADASGDATGITFTDNLDDALTGLAATGLPLSPACDPDGPGGDPGTGILSGSAMDTLLTLSGATLSPGESCVMSVTLDVPIGAAPGSYTNTTSGVSATVDGVPATSTAASDDLDVAGMVITKEFLGDPVIAGELLTLRFTLENVHPTDDATDIRFTDSLSAVLPGTPDISTTGAPTANTCGGNEVGTSLNLDYRTGSLMAGMTCIVDYEIFVPPGAADGTYNNTTGIVSATQGGGVVIFENAFDTLTIESDLLLLSKAFTDDPVAPGGSVTLELTLTNLDPGQAASDVDFTDDLGAALTGLTFDGVLFNDCAAMVTGTGTTVITAEDAALAMGGSCTIRVSLTVPGGTAAGLYTNTTSGVTGDLGGFAVSGDPASDDLEVIQLLVFSKSFDGPTTATGTAILTFNVTNPGTDTATGISFTDDLDDVVSGLIATSLPSAPCGDGSEITGIGFLTFSGGELPPLGGTCIFDVEVLVPAIATAGTFPNVTSDLFESGLTVADPATADLVIEPPPTFAKDFMPDTILAGGTSTLLFTIDNGASALAADNLDFTDNLPAGVVVATVPSASTTCTGGTITAVAGTGVISYTGGSVTAGASCTVQADVTAGGAGVYDNTTGDLTSTSGSSGSASDTLTVLAADLSVTKTDGVTTAVPGQSVIYTIVASNLGPDDDPSVALTDAFPSPPLTCTYVSVAAGGAAGNTAAGAGDLAEILSMPAGSSVTYTVTCAIDPDATGTLSNTATIAGSLTDPVPGNNSATDDDTVLTPEADVSVTKTDGVTTAVPGQTTLTYIIVVANAGPSDDPAAFVADAFPADLTCTWTSVAAGGATGNTPAGSGDVGDTLSLPPGSSVTYTASCTIDAAATGTLSNTATVTPSVTDPAPGNNSATDDDTVLTPEADLSVVKDGPATVTVGEEITYTLSVTNDGPSAATGVSLDDPTPTGLNFVSATAPCAAGFPCDLVGIDVDEEVTVDVTFEVPFDYAGPDPIVNSATVSTDVTDNVPGNDTDDAETDVVFDTEPPVVTGVATAAGPVAACDTVRSLVTAIEVTIEDDLSPIENAGDVASYLLLEAGADRDFSTTACGGAAGDDVAVAIDSVTLVDTPPTAVATLNLAAPLDAGLYRLLVCDTITDAAGNALDGDDDGTPGPDFVLSFFRADPLNLFENGHFDDCPVTLDPWMQLATAPNTITPGTPGADDFEASPLSASARFAHSTPDAGSIAQCVEVEAGAVYDLAARWRFDPPMGALAVLAQTCDFFDAAGCTGTSLGPTTFVSILEDEGGAWQLIAGEVIAPAGAVSALCDFTTEAIGGDPNFDLYLDGLSLSPLLLEGPIFIDGFESGGVAPWSSIEP